MIWADVNILQTYSKSMSVQQHLMLLFLGLAAVCVPTSAVVIEERTEVRVSCTEYCDSFSVGNMPWKWRGQKKTCFHVCEVAVHPAGKAGCMRRQLPTCPQSALL
jgi:hypothetical protein